MAAPMKHSDMSVPNENNHENDKFRVQFKRYKRRKPPPDLSEVIDFWDSVLVSQNHPKVTCQLCAMTSATKLGLKPVDQWRCFTLQGAPGFVYIENPFRPGYQHYWIKRCLQDYPNKPNVCNLDSHHSIRGGLSLWDDDSDAQSKKKSLMDQLRWVTLGYHYDWTAKLYHPHNRTPFPGDLADLSAFVASVMGFPAFRSQAGIVSYYHSNSTLGGHTDHSEFDFTAPIISYSFGHSAIFLLGGKTKETSPLAMYLHSGDIIFMGGQSRLAYHAVPRILIPEGSMKLPSCLDRVEDSEPLGSSCKSASEPTGCCDIPRPSQDTTDSLSLSGNKNHTSAPVPPFSSCDTEISKEDSNMHERTETSKAYDSSFRFDTGDDALDAFESSLKSGEGTCGKHSPRCAAQGLVDSDYTVIHETMRSLQDPQAWERFAKFMSNTRINISVRQVTGPGRDFPSETVNICHEPSICTHSDLSGSKRKAEQLDQG
ncbi:nucleic acid dioxygenase ALKBH1-like [Patiria miniata]|uniref:Alpha-ketoglutarate-dependent dioxygenase AlkB-like domain-containing protein n=1 Tax=Patiria miniata TaxID=46514 RepID=A0A914BB83_PATMI|nr:nucleic acid dioxygenase ALKBH1-like [Patiria miniata]